MGADVAMPTISRFLSLLAVVLTAIACSSSVEAPFAGSEPARPLPEFSIQDLEGNLFTNENLDGRVALVNFWATWCGPCKIEMPWFVEFQRRYKDQGFTVLAISLDEEGWDPVREFAARLELNFPIVLGDDAVADDFGGIHALPTTLMVNRAGEIVATHTGLVSRSTYEQEIEAML